ncbi:pre-mRNA 3' end processing protein WDR33 isoform X4 [Onychostruthus taczanowskii]|uniref:pre-mRNA 3' end processing protein WDR33 isoform X4 n=2 Tax=Neoaves TaxID=3078114 RepID=UPI001B808C10|nr:pre-mRNA 3' end processing protein WDR33 isoform X4 [Onychostruthus taczanowskii]
MAGCSQNGPGASVSEQETAAFSSQEGNFPSQQDAAMATEIGSPPRFFHMPRFQHQAPRQLFYKRPDFAQQQAMQQLTFDGKRMRKAVNRKTIDYNPSVIKYLENRVWQRDQRDMRAIQPDAGYYNDLVPPIGMLNNPMNAVTTKFVRTSTNKVKCPVFVVRWTPEGRRLVTGASSGEFTLWNGLTFNFETILQAHDSPVRAMTWSHNDMWMLTADHGGYVKYWQSNMNNVKMFQAHKEAIREASFSPTDNKFATCSDDGTVRIWDFLRCHEERILREDFQIQLLEDKPCNFTFLSLAADITPSTVKGVLFEEHRSVPLQAGEQPHPGHDLPLIIFVLNLLPSFCLLFSKFSIFPRALAF